MNRIFLCLISLSSLLSAGQNSQIKAVDDIDKNIGFFNITKIGYVVNTSLKQEIFIEGEGNFFSETNPSSSGGWSIQTVNGYFLTPTFSLGVALGYENYQNPSFDALPIMLDTRLYFTEYDDSFYTYLNVGPNIRIGGNDSDLKKGVALNIGLGYKFKAGKNLFFVSDLSYNHRTISLTNEGIKTSDNIIKINGVGLSFGIIF